MDKGKIIRLLLIPIIVGLIVTIVVRQLLPAAAPSSAPDQVEMVPVVAVATKEAIPAKTKLTEIQVALKPVPKTLLTGSELQSVQEVAGQTTMVALEPGEIILKSRLAVDGKGGLPYRIPNGYRAISVRIDEFTGVAGHPEPGDLVDLVFVLPAKMPERPTATSRLLYENVLVLAKGPYTPPATTGASAKNTSAEPPKITSLTVALTPQAAVEVALAEQLGLIKLLLRPAIKEGNTGRILTNESSYK